MHVYMHERDRRRRRLRPKDRSRAAALTHAAHVLPGNGQRFDVKPSKGPGQNMLMPYAKSHWLDAVRSSRAPTP